MLGSRRAATTGTPFMTTLPHGTWAPWTATIGTTTTTTSGGHRPIMGPIGGHRVLDQPGADEAEGFAFPGLVLAPVLGQLGGAQAEPRGAEPAAGIDRRQLPVIADQDHLGLGLEIPRQGAHPSR
jgi:hypothetical protein